MYTERAQKQKALHNVCNASIREWVHELA